MPTYSTESMIIMSLKKLLFNICSLLFVLASPLLQGCTSHPDTNTTLEESLKILFCNELGYTLIGAKPVSEADCPFIEQYLCKESLDDICSFLDRAFQKSSRYILKIERDSTAYMTITLMHIPSLKKIIAHNRKLRSFIQKKYGSFDGFLAHFRRSSDSIFGCLNYSNYLLGIAFGYGHKSTQFFIRYKELEQFLQRGPFSLIPWTKPPFFTMSSPLILPFHINSLRPPPRIKKKFGSLEKEWQFLQKIFCFDAKNAFFQVPYNVQLPFFFNKKGSMRQRRFSIYRDQLARLFYNRSLTDFFLENSEQDRNEGF